MRWVCGLLLLVGLTGCMPDDTEPAPDDHARLLEADRTTAGETVRALAPRLAADLAGTVRSASGGYRGCRGRSPEGVAAFEYVASARVDAGRAADDDLLATVPSYLEGEVTEVPGGRRVSTERDGVVVSVTTRPGAGRFVLLSVVGRCHDVPADEQDDWLGRGVDDLT